MQDSIINNIYIYIYINCNVKYNLRNSRQNNIPTTKCTFNNILFIDYLSQEMQLTGKELRNSISLKIL